MSEGYKLTSTIIASISSVLIFIGSYVYCIATYGFLFGVGLGWLPSAIVAFIAFGVVWLLWPLIAFGLLVLAAYLLRGVH
jgi:hypothetical protein